MSAKPDQVRGDVARILEIGPYPPPVGGWSQRIALLQRAIEEQGHRCTVLNIGVGRRIPSDEYECVRSIPEYVAKLVRFARLRFLFHLHINGSSGLRVAIALVAALVTVAFGRRPVLTFHAGESQAFFPRQRSAAMVPVLWFLFRVSRCVICNNEGVKRLIAEYGIAPEKIISIPAFSPQYLSDRTAEPSDDLRRFFGESTLRVLVCTDGDGAASVFEVLARACVEWPLLRVLIVSPDLDELLGEMRARPLPSENILVVGPLLHSEFLALLASVCVYLRCRAWDGDAASVREALALGTPVIANDTGSRPASVRTYAHGDRAALWAALAAVLRDPATARREVEAPPLDDTLQYEVEILLDAYERRGPGVGGTRRSVP